MKRKTLMLLLALSLTAIIPQTVPVHATEVSTDGATVSDDDSDDDSADSKETDNADTNDEVQDDDGSKAAAPKVQQAQNNNGEFTIGKEPVYKFEIIATGGSSIDYSIIRSKDKKEFLLGDNSTKDGTIKVRESSTAQANGESLIIEYVYLKNFKPGKYHFIFKGEKKDSYDEDSENKQSIFIVQAKVPSNYDTLTKDQEYKTEVIKKILINNQTGQKDEVFISKDKKQTFDDLNVDKEVKRRQKKSNPIPFFVGCGVVGIGFLGYKKHTKDKEKNKQKLKELEEKKKEKRLKRKKENQEKQRAQLASFFEESSKEFDATPLIKDDVNVSIIDVQNDEKSIFDFSSNKSLSEKTEEKTEEKDPINVLTNTPTNTSVDMSAEMSNLFGNQSEQDDDDWDDSWDDSWDDD